VNGTLFFTANDGSHGVEPWVVPSVLLGGVPSSSPEGTAVTVTGTVVAPDADAVYTFAWNVTKNGSAFASGSGAAFTFTPDDNGTYVVTLTVTDDGGGSDTRTATILVTNVPPTAAVAGPANGVRGQPRTFTVSASDPSPVDQAAGFTYMIDWGDGSPVATIEATPGNGAGVALNHVFTTTGSYTLVVTATDKDGGVSTQVTQTVTIVPVEMQGDTLVVGGTLGSDTILFQANGAGVEVVVNGVAQGVFTGLARLVAYGQAGDDHIEVDDGIVLPAELYAGDGNNYLQGGGGPNILVGGGGHNVLIGGNARNLLIAGSGTSQLTGGNDEDILIAGSTVYDHDATALRAIMAEWLRTDEDYATRVAHLLGGSGVPLLDATTVTGNGGGNTLTGGLGRDLFFGQSALDVSDWDMLTETFIEL
jgi:PKD repeat protein